MTRKGRKRLRATERRLHRLRLKRRRLRAAERRAERKRREDMQRMKDRHIEAALRFLAARAGIGDLDYALHLFARAAAAGKAKDPKEFFAGLKRSAFQ